MASTLSSVGQGVNDLGKNVLQHATGHLDTPAPPTKDAPPTQTTDSQSPFGTVGKAVTDISNQGKDLAGKGFSSGFDIAANISKNTLDLQTNVTSSITGLGGTAIDSVVTV
jgi:hypothetical protein